MSASTSADTRPFPPVDGPLLMSMLDSLPLKRLGESEEAGLLQVSLPHPPAPPGITGLGQGAAYVEPLGQWPNAELGSPRRLLITSDAPSGAPAELTAVTRASVDPESALPTARDVVFHDSTEMGFMWENHMLRIDWGGRRIGLAMGLRVKHQIHWWQGCRLVEEEVTPFCRTIKMAGAIPYDMPTLEEMFSHTGFGIPHLHKHNWINGDLYIRMYANGVLEVFAHHINARYVDMGSEFRNVAPIVGFFSFDGDSDTPVALEPTGPDGASLMGDWPGEVTDVSLGDIRLDVSEVGPLAEEKWPGNWDQSDEFDGLTLWTPYYGACLYGGVHALDTTGGPWHAYPSQRIWPLGMARTLRFSLSMSPERSPKIARYQAPAWWYGMTAELLPMPYLPVEQDQFSIHLERMQIWVREQIEKRGFEVGAVPRHAGGRHAKHRNPAIVRPEPGWDGDVPYAQFLNAYRSGEALDLRQALQSAYHQTDIVTCHATKMVRMHGFPDGAYSLPMVRPLGALAGYLETGDPYLLETAKAIIEMAYRTHLNSWPRLAIGRDACFVRGAVFLYRYFASEHYRAMARKCCVHVTQTQRENGSWGDQGGGAGIHQWAGYITKPWMLCLGSSATLDYLMLFPEDTVLRDCIVKLGDWFMANRWERDGFTGWSYQHDFVGKPALYTGKTRKGEELPSRGQWQDEQVARIMGFCSYITGDPKYHDAYMESAEYRLAQVSREKLEEKDPSEVQGGGHGYASIGVHLPWLQCMRWRPRWTPQGLVTEPVPALARGEKSATITTPTGPTQVKAE